MTTRRQVLEEASALFNDKLYFEAHDVLEDAWSGAHGEERAFLQGLIHVSVGMYHVAAANHPGAVNLLSRGTEALAPFTPAKDGLDVSSLVAKAAQCLEKCERARAGEPVEWDVDDVPRMDFVAVE